MGAPGEDHISSLPDELLHCILVRLGSAREAVRTGVLSRRWRHILGPLPELILDGNLDDLPLESFLHNVDAALAACDAPILKRLDIDFTGSVVDGSGIPAVRAVRWLRFASERVVNDLYVYLPRMEVDHGEEAVLELPACEAVTTIELVLGRTWRIQPPSVGLFRALTKLTMDYGGMDGRELTALVCTRCPCLVHLNLSLMQLVNAFDDVSIRSDSLHSLRFYVSKTRQLEIVAPRLEILSVGTNMEEARICAPKLSELDWSAGIYDPHRHQFDGVGRRLRVLKPSLNASLMQQFEEIDELRLFICIGQRITDYESFLNETKTCPSVRSWAYA